MRTHLLIPLCLLASISFAIAQETAEPVEEKRPVNPFCPELKVISGLKVKLASADGGSKTRLENLLAEAEGKLAKAVEAKRKPLEKRLDAYKKDLADAGNKTRKKAIRKRMKSTKEQLDQVLAWAVEDLVAAPEENGAAKKTAK